MVPKIQQETVRQKVVKFAQELLLDEKDWSTITPDLISEKIDMIVRMNPRWGENLDRKVVTDELIRRFSIWIGEDTTLKDDTGHEPWLVTDRKKEWRYWQRYREWSERKLSYAAVEALDRSTDSVLGLLEDPLREGPWDRRGLVVGHVQSGKTSHYTGLICKAADAGYKIIVVLAGLHNNLRSQTQMRLDEGFLGFETSPVQDDTPVIGVGEIDGDIAIRPNFATNRSNAGDFTTRASRNLGIAPEHRPWLFVVKKNKTVLERLNRWIRNHVANVHNMETDSRVVTHLPLLLIDDEADHASVDTGEQVFDAEGRPDEEHHPTAINRLVRKILHSFTRAAYVGYTATPFANIFIHERGETREEGPDLFPAAFIINLAAPSNYIGPARVFGLREKIGRSGGIPVLRLIQDHSTDDGFRGWMPQKHKNGHVPYFEGRDELPKSLNEGIDAFLLACAVRRLRGQGAEHTSMLIHVTRFNSVQGHVHRQVTERIRNLKQRLTRSIDHERIISNLKGLWETDFLPTTKSIRAEEDIVIPDDCLGWPDIERVLSEVISDIQVRMINGTAKDALDYVGHTGTGLKVIAIGGDKLSRGLTLEGLCVSYFLRASRMYDTLMQMGRWFGYRPGYLDVCRLYTTSELSSWFGYITDAAEELREEFDYMVASGGNPRQYGLKVQAHPVLMVTSPLKMRSARNLMLSFSGHLLETVALFKETDKLATNLEAAKRLIARLGKPEVNPVRIRNGSRQKWTGYLWDDVPAVDVVDFLSNYKTHPQAHKVNSLLLAEFIRRMIPFGELTRWTVVLIGGGEGRELEIVEGVSVDMLHRKADGKFEDRYSIGRAMSSRDEGIVLDEDGWNAALALTQQAWHSDPARLRNDKKPESPSGQAIREVRGFGAEGVSARPDKGVIFLYPLDPKNTEAGFTEEVPPVIAVAVSFPGSRLDLMVEYKVNNVMWEQEYGSSE